MGFALSRISTVALLCSSFSAIADDSTQWGLGVGVASTQKPYAGIDREYNPLPLVHIENRYFQLLGTTAEIKLPGLQWGDDQQVNAALIVRYDGAGYESDDARILQGMAKRKGGFWGGAKLEWRNEIATLFTDWTHDLSGNSQGQRVRAGVEKRWQLGDHFSLTPRVVANWYDSKYIDYYYGVAPDEARSWRPEYQADASLNTEIGLRSAWQFNRHHIVMLDLQATLLGSEIKDSPLVDRTNENRVFLSYLYNF
ncbi:MipA/OmpV family protein [Salmonella enterica]